MQHRTPNQLHASMYMKEKKDYTKKEYMEKILRILRNKKVGKLKNIYTIIKEIK